MSSNSMTDYVEAFRANLPNGVTYDTTIDRYFFSGRRFINEWSLLFYIGYLNKLGSESIYAVLGIEPDLILAFKDQYYKEKEA